jgi:hypothetical protein
MVIASVITKGLRDGLYRGDRASVFFIKDKAGELSRISHAREFIITGSVASIIM